MQTAANIEDIISTDKLFAAMLIKLLISNNLKEAEELGPLILELMKKLSSAFIIKNKLVPSLLHTAMRTEVFSPSLRTDALQLFRSAIQADSNTFPADTFLPPKLAYIICQQSIPTDIVARKLEAT